MIVIVFSSNVSSEKKTCFFFVSDFDFHSDRHFESHILEIVL